MPTTYSFGDVNVTIEGPGISYTLSDNNIADEGVTVEMSEDKNTMTTGATRGGMHSKHESRAGRITVRCLKNSLNHRVLANAYRYQDTSSALWGRNLITVENSVWQDNHTASQCAFVRMPTNNNAKDGGTMEWVFESLDIDSVLGDGIEVL